MLLDGEVLPLGLHLLIGFQHGPGFGPADAHFEAALHDLVNDHCVDALALQVGPHGNQQQVDGVVFVEGFQHTGPAGGQQTAPAFLQGGGDAGK